MGCLAGVSRTEHLQNTAIRDRLGGGENVLQRIAGRRMKYFTRTLSQVILYYHHLSLLC